MEVEPHLVSDFALVGHDEPREIARNVQAIRFHVQNVLWLSGISSFGNRDKDFVTFNNRRTYGKQK